MKTGILFPLFCWSVSVLCQPTFSTGNSPEGYAHMPSASSFFSGHPLSQQSIADSISLENRIRIYPVPVGSTLTISVDETLPVKTGYYVLYNLLGKEIRKGRITQVPATIDTNGLPNGYYVIRVVLDDRHFTRKIIKNNR